MQTYWNKRKLLHNEKGSIVTLFWDTNCCLHTRASKYNVRELGTYFECEGVQCIYFNFTW